MRSYKPEALFDEKGRFRDDIAGIAPKGTDADALLWEGSTLDLGTVHRQPGLEIIADASRSWTPAAAMRNHVMALKNLDWRWRIKTIAETLSVETTTLRAEIARLSARIEALHGLGLRPEHRDAESRQDAGTDEYHGT